jgi:hypothetical protein
MFDTEAEFYTHESFDEEGVSAEDDEHDYGEDKSHPSVGVVQHPIITEHKEKEIDHPLEFITDMPPLDAITTDDSQQQSVSEAEQTFLPPSPERLGTFSNLSPLAPPFVASSDALDQEIDEDGEVIIPPATTAFKSPSHINVGEEVPAASVPPKSRMIDLSRVSERTLPMKKEQPPHQPVGSGTKKTRRGASSLRRHARRLPEDHQ